MCFAKDPEKVCGVVEMVMGQAEILSADRSVLQVVHPHSMIACNSWVLVKKGQIQVSHFLGPKLILPEGVFLRFSSTEDLLTLYRGEMMVMISSLQKNAFSFVSPVARAQMTLGKSIFLFNEKEKTTQLISLSGKMSLENRFESQKKVFVNPGEISELHFYSQRVFPLPSSAIGVTSLKEHFVLFRLSSSEQDVLLAGVNARRNRKVLAESTHEVSRSLASEGAALKSDPSFDQDFFLKKQLSSASDQDVADLLHPNDTRTDHSDMKLNISPTKKTDLQKTQKKELMDDLSQFHPQLSY
jgi:hypothetical protein